MEKDCQKMIRLTLTKLQVSKPSSEFSLSICNVNKNMYCIIINEISLIGLREIEGSTALEKVGTWAMFMIVEKKLYQKRKITEKYFYGFVVYTFDYCCSNSYI